MADAKISELAEHTTPALDDELAARDVSEALAIDQNKRLPISALLSLVYPVGAVYISTVSTSPADLFGFGTWAVFGAGRTIVSLDAADSDFDTSGATGGSKTVTLTEAQIPAHTHVQDAHGHSVSDPGHAHVENLNSATTGGLRGATPDTSTNTSTASGYSTASATTGLTVDSATATNQNTGGDEAHNNMPPFIVAYVWERTA